MKFRRSAEPRATCGQRQVTDKADGGGDAENQDASDRRASQRPGGGGRRRRFDECHRALRLRRTFQSFRSRIRRSNQCCRLVDVKRIVLYPLGQIAGAAQTAHRWPAAMLRHRKKQQRAVDPTTFCGIIALLDAPEVLFWAALLFNNLNNR